MKSTRSMFRLVFAGLLFLLAFVPGVRAGDTNDTARFLAGMPLPAGSPLADLADQPGWRQHAANFNGLFKRVDERQFARVRAWAKANITVRKPTLYYFFSGPDFLYANAFYPTAKTYIMAGLEPPGAIPNLKKMSDEAVASGLKALGVSIRSIMSLSFFRTIDMKTDLKSTPINGTIPVLYVFLARSGKVVQEATLVRLGADGSVHPDGEPDQPKGARGVKITFSSPGGPTQTLYYFGTNLANDGFKKAGFDEFCAKFAPANALVKSASYLMHASFFSHVRSFLLKNSASILQDDSGIPVGYFGSAWELQPYGVYMKPISLFAAQYQPKLDDLYRKSDKGAMNFGIGYRYQPNTSNLLLAVKQESGEVEAKPPARKAAPKAKPAETEDAPPAEDKDVGRPARAEDKEDAPPAGPGKDDAAPDASAPKGEDKDQ